MSLTHYQKNFYRFGCHRVLEPSGVLPQPAWRVDNTPVARATETLVDVDTLHIDSTSFTQIRSQCNADPEKMKRHIQAIVQQRGKMHNPITGSGGTLRGTIVQLDEEFGNLYKVSVGDTIVSLTSLSWLPLYLEEIHAIYLDRAEVRVKGKAIFFRSNPLTGLPGDLSPDIAIPALDVAGAPARVIQMVQPGQRVTVLGAGGTAGLLTLCALRQSMGHDGEIIAIDTNERALQDIASLDAADVLVKGDATQAFHLLEEVHAACQGKEYQADLTINVVNVPNTELASILLTQPKGRLLFFSTATNFTTAALGAEGLARPVEMYIGNGYVPNHSNIALQLLRDYASLREIFTQRFTLL